MIGTRYCAHSAAEIGRARSVACAPIQAGWDPKWNLQNSALASQYRWTDSRFGMYVHAYSRIVCPFKPVWSLVFEKFKQLLMHATLLGEQNEHFISWICVVLSRIHWSETLIQELHALFSQTTDFWAAKRIPLKPWSSRNSFEILQGVCACYFDQPNTPWARWNKLDVGPYHCSWRPLCRASSRRGVYVNSLTCVASGRVHLPRCAPYIFDLEYATSQWHFYCALQWPNYHSCPIVSSPMATNPLIHAVLINPLRGRLQYMSMCGE